MWKDGMTGTPTPREWHISTKRYTTVADDVIPILVLGSARNGTTWLCNILANHPDVAVAQHPAHWGFHESNVFKNARYWGNLSTLDRRIHFTTVYPRTDHCTLVGGTEETISAAIDAAASRRGEADFYDVFFELMDRFAGDGGKCYWLTKLDPLMLLYPREVERFLDRLFHRYPHARLVSIQRELPSVVQSYLNMEGRGPQERTSSLRAPFFTLFGVARYLVHYRRIRSIQNTHATIALTYDRLRRQPAETMRDTCRQLGIPYNDGLLMASYKPNSSLAYRSRVRRLGPIGRLVVLGMIKPILLVFWPLAVALVRYRERYRPIVPPVYFKLMKLTRFPQRFRTELLELDDTALAELLFSEGDEQ